MRTAAPLTALVVAATACLALPSDAYAVRPAMDPQVRMHAGLSVVENPSPFGAEIGFDSRVGRNLALDAGVFFTPGSSDLELTPDRAEARDHFSLRHGLYAMPGLRLPHSQPRNFRWDLYGRAGGGVVWTQDRYDKLTTTGVAGQMDVAGFVGVDAVVMKDAVGLRAHGRVAMTQVYDNQLQNDVFYWSPQYGVELVYQFGYRKAANY